MEVARAVIMLLLSIVLPLGVQLIDKRRLDPGQKDRSWNIASWACALYAFGPFSMLGWIFVTRRRWWRCLLGPLWTLPVLGSLVLADQLLQRQLLGQVSEPIHVAELASYALVSFVGMALTLLSIELITIGWRWLKQRLRSA